MTYATIHSVKFILLLSVMIVAAFLFSFSRAHAYFTTAQEEMRLQDGTGLFLIEYKFGRPKGEVHMPVLAQRGDAKSVSHVSYEILGDNGEKAEGEAFGMVLSSAKLNESGMYVTQKGFANAFTLAVFFTPAAADTNESYRLQVTDLPFRFDGTQQLQLNSSELKYYTTKFLTL